MAQAAARSSWGMVCGAAAAACQLAARALSLPRNAYGTAAFLGTAAAGLLLQASFSFDR